MVKKSFLERMARLWLVPVVLMALMLVTPSSLVAQDWAKAKLNKSPRHQEWVTIQYAHRKVQAYVVYPEVKGKAPVVMLVHEIFGLSDWARSMADDLAAEGYIVIVPDLLSEHGPKGGGSSDFPDMDSTVKAVFQLDPRQVMSDLKATADYAVKLPSANGKLAVAGFCWGGGQAFTFATLYPNLNAAFVFYGSAPESGAMKAITAPVYGFYAGDDARITATVPATTTAMQAAGAVYQPVIYDGAGHGFMRAGEAPDASPANRKAREEALARMLALLKKM